MRNKLLLFISALLWCWNITAQQNVYSRSDASTGNWWDDSNPWYRSCDTWSINRPDKNVCYQWDPIGRNNVFIGHNNNTTMSVNGAWFQLRMLTLESTATVARTFNNNSGGISIGTGIYNESSATHTFNVPIGVDGALVAFMATEGNLVFTSDFFLNANMAAFYGSNITTLSGNVSGTGGRIVRASGTGRLILSGTNTYTGGTTVEGGILELQSSIPSSAVTVKYGAKLLISGNDVTIASLTIESGVVEIESGKSLTVTGVVVNYVGNSGIVIKSGGSLIHNTAGISATAERYIEGFSTPSNGWHFLSSPVAAQPISTFHTPGSGSDFFKWDEVANEWVNRTAVGGGLNGSFEANFQVGKGYLIANNSTSTKQFTGSLNVANVSISGLTNTSGNTNRGWHLLGNPFSSAIKFNLGSWAKSNIASYAQVWNESTASYKVLAGNQIIPANNGFIVYTSGSGSLTIPGDARLHSDSAWYKDADWENEIVLLASDPTGQTEQETILSFNPDATSGFDMEYDSYFLSGFAPKFYSISDNSLFALNTLPMFTEDLIIPLGFVKNQNENFSIELKQGISDQTMFLIDLKTNKTHNLSEAAYEFVSLPGDDPNRFLLKFSAVGVDETKPSEEISAWVYGNTLYMNNEASPAFIEVFDLMGRSVYNTQLTGNGLQSLTLNQPAGVYLVRINTGSALQTIKAKIQY